MSETENCTACGHKDHAGEKCLHGMDAASAFPRCTCWSEQPRGRTRTDEERAACFAKVEQLVVDGYTVTIQPGEYSMEWTVIAHRTNPPNRVVIRGPSLAHEIHLAASRAAEAR